MNNIRDEKDHPEVLWHYTSSAAFDSILNSKKIRLCDPRSSNDRSERSYGRMIVNEVLKQEFQDLLSEFPNLLTNFELESTLVLRACFSSEEDILSQWIQYGDEGKGYALGIAYASIAKLTEKNWVRDSSIDGADGKPISFAGPAIGPVTYGDKASKERVRKYCRQYLESDKTEEDLRSLKGRILMLAAFLKEQGWRHEKEWRHVHGWLTTDGGQSYKSPRFPGVIVKESTLQLYEETKLMAYFDDDHLKVGYTPVLVKVMKGPQNRASVSDVELLLSKHLYDEVDVSGSKLSYQSPH